MSENIQNPTPKPYILLCRPRWLSWMRVHLETRRSRVQPPPKSATFFRGDWSWNIFYGHSLPSADSRRAVVSFWRKNVLILSPSSKRLTSIVHIIGGGRSLYMYIENFKTIFRVLTKQGHMGNLFLVIFCCPSSLRCQTTTPKPLKRFVPN